MFLLCKKVLYAIQTISGNKRVINLEPVTTIRQIKEQLFAMESIQADQRRILSSGRAIEDTQTIESSSIVDGQAIHMILNLEGGF